MSDDRIIQRVDDMDFDHAQSFWSVQFRMNGAWITEKTRLVDELEAIEVARNLKATLVGSPRLRINECITHSWEVTNDL